MYIHYAVVSVIEQRNLPPDEHIKLTTVSVLIPESRCVLGWYTEIMFVFSDGIV